MSTPPPIKAPRRRPSQGDLFGDLHSAPDGFRYRPELITAEEELDLVGRLGGLSFQPFDFHGHLANRRVAGFGYRYDYGSRGVVDAPPMPDWLLPLRERAAALVGQPGAALAQVLINEYRPGAGVGWHRDRPQFGEVIAVSLLSGCDLRFRRSAGERWERWTTGVEARSAYLLSGPARHDWEHSVPPVIRHRYSITFRTLSQPQRQSPPSRAPG
jgi:alkylated DNA repair dioxygenase AlkB